LPRIFTKLHFKTSQTTLTTKQSKQHKGIAMAERRMFAKKIIDSARFIKMPAETQSFYFHLSMRADDDGIVEAFSVMRLLGISEDNLKILVAKDFVTVLNDDLVTHISDWKEHNLIRADRKVDSIYKGLLLQVVPDIALVEKKERADRKHNENTWDGNGTAMGRHSIGKDSIGKDSIGKDSIGKDSIGKDSNKVQETQFLPSCISSDVWNEWVQHRKEIKKPLTPTTIKKQFKQLEDFNRLGMDTTEVINASIAGGYAGLFALRTGKKYELPKSKFDTSMETYYSLHPEQRPQTNFIEGEIA
jgi:hypothetical protein